MRARKFVLQALDPATGSPRVEALLRIRDLEALRAALGLADGEDPDLRAVHEVAPDALDRLGALSDPPFAPDPVFTQLDPWHGLREVPYLVHTGFELPLMLEGRKPLAVFSDLYPVDWLDELLARFDPAVSEGRIVRRLVDRPASGPRSAGEPCGLRIREAYFALPGEEWRIDAAIRLRREVSSGWTEAMERREGALLGYEDWQNDWWIAHRFRRLSGTAPADPCRGALGPADQGARPVAARRDAAGPGLAGAPSPEGGRQEKGPPEGRPEV
ncbi:hypothetical protein M446_0732 [Methylobacterium sp. 4-46]|uniref:hypothetical protein n=1 Tax=unclassified Methylobacterium TaxID=2615210 RepID=UPI000152C31E|nr:MULTISPECIES: hypothetical protein [Methylobacterium]ACA15291.1 hypothetical protein M446_0732 [Methylobacterium sp. 4-46]WFT81017.1 hypothetical protein QA634_03690 [Methylobacterium nodulans]